MRFSVSSEGQLIVAKLQGSLTRESLVQFWEALAATPEYNAAQAGLIFLEYTRWDMSGADMFSLAGQHGLRPIRWATVTDNDLSYGMSRMFASLASDGAKFEVFRNEKDALMWLAA